MTDPEAFSGILERLLCSLVDDKRSVSVDYSELQARVNWSFICDVNCIGKIVGKGGSRLRALRLIVEQVGQQSHEVWWLDQPSDLPGERRGGRNDAEVPESHNPEGDFELLKDLLLALGVNATLGVTGDVNSGFTFLIAPAQIQDATALQDPLPAIYSVSQRETDPLALSTAISSVMRAIGANQGCRYWVRVE